MSFLKSMVPAEQYYPLFLYGIVFTLGISIAGTVIGFVIGLIVASIRTIPEHENDSAVKRAPRRPQIHSCRVRRGLPRDADDYPGGRVLLRHICRSRHRREHCRSHCRLDQYGAYMAEIIRGASSLSTKARPRERTPSA